MMIINRWITNCPCTRSCDLVATLFLNNSVRWAVCSWLDGDLFCSCAPGGGQLRSMDYQLFFARVRATWLPVNSCTIRTLSSCSMAGRHSVLFAAPGYGPLRSIDYQLFLHAFVWFGSHSSLHNPYIDLWRWHHLLELDQQDTHHRST